MLCKQPETINTGWSWWGLFHEVGYLDDNQMLQIIIIKLTS